MKKSFQNQITVWRDKKNLELFKIEEQIDAMIT